MKATLLACGVILVGLALLATLSGTDLVPSGVRAVLDDVTNIW